MKEDSNRLDFLDEATITARSGDGGQGCVSFRRAKFLPKGGPDGGNGGTGGHVSIRASEGINSLIKFKFKRNFSAQNGKPGSGKNCTGKDGKNLVIEVPPGTIIYDKESGDLIADLIEEGQEILVLPGGQGGKGNQHFATSTNRAPRMAQPGIPGQAKRFRLSLKYLADVGLVGLPNAGKSTLLSRLTMARPKIDSYPFTTLVPNLGVLSLDGERTLTIADIPGIIEGASEGRGLGHRFLKHIERTKLLVHLVDISYVPRKDLLEDFHILRSELEHYDRSLLEKHQMVLINKIDLHETGQRDVEDLMKALTRLGLEVIPVSALSGEGMEDFKLALSRRFFDG